MGGRASSSNNSTTNVTTNTSNTNTNLNLSNIDNSQKISSNSDVVSNNTNTQTTTNLSNVNNSTSTNINSTSNTYNIDSSIKNTSNFSGNVTDNIVKCGMDAQGAQDLVANIDQSININNNASNTFIVTGNNNTISDVKLESMLTSYGPTVDRSCVQKALTEAKSEQDATNIQSSKASGDATTIGIETGGNVSSQENRTVNENANKTSGESQAGGETKNTTDKSANFDNNNKTDNKTSAKTDQSSTASATGSQTGIGQGSFSGSNILGVVGVIAVLGILGVGGFFAFKMITNKPANIDQPIENTVTAAAEAGQEVVEQVGGTIYKIISLANSVHDNSIYIYYGIIGLLIAALLMQTGYFAKKYDKLILVIVSIIFVLTNNVNKIFC